ncbi:protein-tyrosine phosphatase [Secundilactobacillus odoratitofui DSM 19909 = JCM 15043]|uniref:Protein-tyrosine phosphatase n=1 Tax=Secundilactobacillus odoratitofui DSM 19909 = JCM 15043 TaxID=1423776 RepID=A0A0R1LST4_9LACO|nr:tyrosine-protein phosphatase [Secundilactobacillus odoratitofui]KRK98749.1 protein-tyrosine phosphatase [Secundilactobacillus odoratitofui DSM 19909 = JCM 15043]
MQQTNQRLLKMDHGYNFRELGGYQTADGHTVKWQRVIRTATLAFLSKQDQQSLVDYGVNVDIDFRSNAEVAKSPDLIPASISYHHLPVFPEDQTEVSKSEAEIKAELAKREENGYQHMLDTYQEMITTSQSHQAYQAFFAALLANTSDKQTLLFHCTAGKDRTGMGAVFLLSALGVPHELIKQDYLLTNEALSPLITDRLTKAQNEGITGTTLESIKALMTVSSDYFDTAMAAVKAQYGDMAHFLTDALALSDQDIADLKQLYLD